MHSESHVKYSLEQKNLTLITIADYHSSWSISMNIIIPTKHVGNS